jgi:hypothetical protein
MIQIIKVYQMFKIGNKINKINIFITVGLPLILTLSNQDFLLAKPVAKFKPLSGEICDRLQNRLSQTLKVKVSLDKQANVVDHISNNEGKSCQLTAKVTGKNFSGIYPVTKTIYTFMIQNGWKVNNQYVADSPESTLRGYSKGKSLGILNIDTMLAKEIKCSDLVPIATCYQKAKPEQITYTINLNLMNR